MNPASARHVANYQYTFLSTDSSRHSPQLEGSFWKTTTNASLLIDLESGLHSLRSLWTYWVEIRCASPTSIPPYLLFQPYSVASLTPCSRANSATFLGSRRFAGN